MKDYVNGDKLQEFAEKLHAKQKTIFATKSEVGSPLVANTASDMELQERIYVYTGSETGYTAGNWYYYDGTEWVSGGVYNSTAFETDDTLAVPGMAADAKATGDAIGEVVGNVDDLQNDLIALDNGLISFHPNTSEWYRGYFDATGTFVSNNQNAAPTNTPFEVSEGDILKIYPNGLMVQVQTYSFSEGVYTRVTNTNYTSDQTLTYTENTYVAIHARKLDGSTLPLDAVTTKIYAVSNIEKRLSGLSSGLTETNALIGNSAMGTQASTITGAIAEHEAEIENLNSDIKTVGYEVGGSVTIQTVSNAATFKLDTPNGRILVEETDAPIFTGTPNIIDLFGLAQGTFVDTHSGVTIEITGNEVYIHGTTTAGFRFDMQKGEFYTDSFANHPGNIDILPNATYTMCFYEENGYSMPTNIYFGRLNSAGTSILASALSTHVGDFYKNGSYFALYSNGAISDINTKFKFGLKIGLVPGSIAPIEGIPFMDYGTTVIQGSKAVELGNFTWTGDSTNYTAVKLLKSNVLTKGHKFAWFGDSISQLRELPNLVSDLIGATVYDCSFAGAPLTYGNPTLYQPTGFMSLCSQIVAGDFSDLSDALDAQEQSGVNVTEKRVHLATLQALDFDMVTDIVVLAGTNDFDNDYVNATNFVSGFSGAIETLLTAYPHLIIHVLSPIWRGDKTEGVTTIPTMPDLVELEKTVASTYSLPFNDLYHSSGINEFTATVYLESDVLHLSAAGDSLLANKCAKCLLSN